MQTLFKELKFEVLPTRALHVPALTVTKTHLRFSISLVNEMGNPLFVRMLLDKENKIFAVQECLNTNESAYKFARHKGLQEKGVACGVRLIHAVVHQLIQDELKTGDRFLVFGDYDKAHKAMVFDLKSSIVNEWH